MATKDHYCLKGDNQHFVSSNENDHQYSNHNLNANQKCSSILETIQSNKSISTSSNSNRKDYETAATITKNVLDQDGFGKNQNQLSSWNKNGGGNSFSNGSTKNGETSKEWKSNKKSSSSNNSTLSLHITAYENSIEAQNELNSSEKKDATNLSKTKINKVLEVLKTGFASMDAFEIPRQQTTEGTNEPEIMGFKASQKLSNPNQLPASLDTTTFSLLGHQKLKILVKIFIDKIQVNVVKADFEGSISISDMLPFIFEKTDLSSKDYEIQSITVMDKKANENIDVTNNYLLQAYDKFQLFLTKKAQQHDIEVILQPDDQEQQQQLSLDISKIQHIKDLSDALSSKLDIKNGEIKIQKFDEDFGESITVNGEEKFDPSKIYNVHVTKVVKFGVRIGPKVSGEKKPAEASIELKSAEALKPSIIAPTPLSTTVIHEECPSLSPQANEDIGKFEVPNMPDSALSTVQKVPKVVPEDFGSSNRHKHDEAIHKFNHNLSAILSTDENPSDVTVVSEAAAIPPIDKSSCNKTDNELLDSNVNPSSDKVSNPNSTNLNFEENLPSLSTGASRFVPPHPVSSHFDRTSRFSTFSSGGSGNRGGGIPRGGITATMNGRGGGSFSSRGGGYEPSSIPSLIGRGGGYTSTRGSSGFRAAPPRYVPRGPNADGQGSDARHVMHHGTVSSPPHDYQPRNDIVDFSRPTPIIHIFDGDADKVSPGMSFKIAGGTIYTFPPLPNFDPTIPREREILRKAGVKHRKKVREMLEHHKKMAAFIEKLRPIYERKD